MDDLKAQSKELNKIKKIHSSEIQINLLSLKSGIAKLELTYYVENAKWYPSYDVRVNKIGEPLQLTYKANIEQNTGIDWKDVNIKLSNAKHNNQNTFKGLKTSYITFYQSTTEMLQGKVSGVNIVKNSGSPGASENIRIRGIGSTYNDPLYVVDGVVAKGIPNLQSDIIESISVVNDASSNAIYGSRASNGVVLITTKKGGIIDNTITENIDISYRIASPVSVLSDKPTSTFDVKSTEVTANYLYKCAPAQNNQTFAIARVANWEKLQLLDGVSNLFYQQTYVGTSAINTKQVVDTLDFNLGQEKNIIVNRKQLTDFNKNQFVGNKKSVTKGCEIEVRNNKNTDVEIELYERVPLSTDKSINIEIKEISGARHNLMTGILIWKLKLSPGETKKLKVEYEVKYPKDRAVSIK